MPRDPAAELPPLRYGDLRHTYMLNGQPDFSFRYGNSGTAPWGGTYHYPPLAWLLHQSGIRKNRQQLHALFTACKALAQDGRLSFFYDDFHTPNGRTRRRIVSLEFQVIAEIPPDQRVIRLVQEILGPNCGGLTIERLTASNPRRQPVFAPSTPQ